MSYFQLDSRLSVNGQLKLTSSEFGLLQELLNAGDRGAFHFLYGEMADNDDARLTAKISTFSDGVGGAAFAANWKLQQDNAEYAGIYNISQQIAQDMLLRAAVDASEEAGTGYLTVNEHFDSASETWRSFDNEHLFPGNLLRTYKDDPGLQGWQELSQIFDGSYGGRSPGAAASVFGLYYSEYTGKRLSDFEGQPGYDILSVNGGSVVVDSLGRTTAVFVSVPGSDIASSLGRTGLYFAQNNSPFDVDYVPTLYSLMGDVGDPSFILAPNAAEYADARRDFNQFAHPNYTGDDDPTSFQPANSPTISISQDATSGRDLIVFGASNDTVLAGSGADSLFGGGGSDILLGGLDDDVVWGQKGSDFLGGDEGHDILRGGFGNDHLYGGAGDDVLEGADISLNQDVLEVFSDIPNMFSDQTQREFMAAFLDGHDLLMGGSGNDLILGGYGSDILFDSGLEEFEDIIVDISPENIELYAYDPGSDRLIGGSGSDLLVYTGGIDTFYGDTGDDSYLISPDFLTNRDVTDSLTIIFEEDAEDESTWFGHDYVIGNGKGLDVVRFEGIRSDEVRVTYDYESTLVEVLSPELEALFLPFIGIDGFDYGDFPVYSTIGSVTIEVIETGSTLHFSNVGGAYVLGSNNVNGSIYIAPLVDMTTSFAFDDGTYPNIHGLLNFENFLFPVNGTTPDNAAVSPESQADERAADLDIPPLEDFGSPDIDFLSGTQFSDNLYGYEGEDFLHGADGDDTLNGGLGGDYLNGGTGFDIASYVNAAQAVDVELNFYDGIVFSGEAEGDTLLNIEGLEGSAFDDRLTGNSEDNELYGGGGNDRLNGGSGYDFLFGGAGDDLLDYGEFVDGGDGDDTIVARSSAAEVLIGGSGNDEIFGSSGSQVIEGGAGDDTIVGNNDNDYMDGGEGIDTLDHSGAVGNAFDADYVDLGAGTFSGRSYGIDTVVNFENFVGGRAIDIVTGSSADNVISGGHRDDQLSGMGGNDRLYGGYHNDILDGGAGDDWLQGDHRVGIAIRAGDAADDVLIGGDGVDTAAFVGDFSEYTISESSGSLFVVSDIDGSDEVRGDVEFLSFADATYTFAELAGNSNTPPSAVDDVVTVVEGQSITFNVLANDIDVDGDSLVLTNFNDREVSEDGYTIIGDLVVNPNSDGSVIFTVEGVYTIFPDIDLGPGETFTTTFDYTVGDQFGGFSTGTVELNIVGVANSPGVIVGTNVDDVLVGSTLDEQMSGGDGQDLFVLADGGGSDTITDFEFLKDSIQINGSLVDPGAPSPGVSVAQSGDDMIVTYGSGDILTIEDITPENFIGTIRGTEGNDSLFGVTTSFTGTPEVISGLGGDDYIEGGAGYNRLNGGAGNDEIEGGSWSDYVFGGDGDDIIRGGSGVDRLYGEAGNDIIEGGSTADELHGGEGDDVLDGGDQDDAHFGGAGNDYIHGNRGFDSFDGGEGIDTIDMSYSSEGMSINLATGEITFPSGTVENLLSFENIVASDAANTLLGSDVANVIEGLRGNDTMTGGAGADTYVFSGGDGTDTITDFDINEDEVQIDGVAIDPNAIEASVTVSQVGPDVRVNYAGGGAVILLGVSLVDWQEASGPATDGIVTGTNSNDVITAATSVDPDGDTINDAGQTIYGLNGADQITAGAGDDMIRGGSQYDTIYAGAGDDEVWGDNGRDTVWLEDGDDTFNDNTQTGTHSLDTVHGGAGADTINGGGGDDTFYGDSGADVIRGGIGNDTLTGGTEDDVLSGGEGLDTFQFVDGDGDDTITDFDISSDVLEINGVAVNPGALPSGMAITQVGTDVSVGYGVSDTVTLQNVDLAAWQGPSGFIGQAGSATVAQGNSDQWFTVTFDQPITNAVVVLGPVEFNGSDPTTTRVRNVTDAGFEFQVDEWNYRDGGHIAETVGWMAVSAGEHTLANGTTIVAGTSDVGTGFETVSFGTTLTDAIVLSEVTTVLESDAVTTRHRNVTGTGFDLRLQEEEALGPHVDEEVSWIAIETANSNGFEAVRTPNQLDEVADEFVFSATFADTPVLLGDLQTYNGGDTSTVRFDGLDTGGVTLRLQEEASSDAELGHTNEVVGYLAIEEGWIV